MDVNAVIFDVGGVLVRTEDRAPRAAWEQRLGLRPGEADELVFDSAPGQAAQRGEIGTEALWDWVASTLGLNNGDAQRFRYDFFAGDRLDHGLLRYIRRLRPARKTAIITNAADHQRHSLTAVYPLADAFDLIVISAEEGMMKPDARIYQRTLARLGIEGPASVFVDDSAANIAGARAVGMQTIHFTPATHLPSELTALWQRTT